MMFHIGQKVVCVDAAIRHPWDQIRLRKGATYTIRGFNDGYAEPGSAVLLEEVRMDAHLDARMNGQERGFYPDRFRPLVERKTDISIFTKMLRPTRTKISVHPGGVA